MLVGNLFKPIEDLEFVEWGYHTYNHLPLIFLSEKRVLEEVKNRYELKSITAPMWRIEDTKDPSRIFNILKKEGYKNTVFHGVNKGIRSFFHKEVRTPENKFGIKCVHVSNYFEGNWNKKKINEVKRDILKNLDTEGVYLLTTHDFTHKNTNNLKELIYFVRRLEKEKRLNIVKLNEA
jgi:peptidoglycan/xylan/chitin deacetylase (PgdA/CDA1 family)